MAGSISASVATHKPRGIVKLKGTIATSAGGVMATTSIGEAWGRIVAIGYDADDLVTGAIVQLLDSDSGAAILSPAFAGMGTADLYFRPSAGVRTSDGVAIARSSARSDVDRDIYVAGDLSIAVTLGGASKGGALYVVVDEGVSS